MAEEKVTQESTGKSYAEFVKPLVSEIRNAVIKVTEDEENKDKYTEFDVYNALALTVTMLSSRNIDDENRQLTNEQSIAIANAMVKAGLDQAQKDESYLSAIIIGASRALTSLNEIIEGTIEDQKEAASTEESAE